MKEKLYRRIAIAIGSITYDETADGKILSDMKDLLEEILDMMDSSQIIVIDHVEYAETEDGEHETL